MGKVFIVLNDEEQVILESICADKNPEEALEFVLKRVAPKANKRLPCLAGGIVIGSGGG